MSILLDGLYLIGFIFYLPIMLVRGKWHGGYKDRFGFLSSEQVRQLGAGRNIWIHAVSVGEVVAIEGLIRGLRADHPDHRVVLSVTTKTGHALAKRDLSNEVLLLWAPLDFSWVVKKFLTAIRPVIYIAAEAELWPNLFRSLASAKVPIVIVNGRISDGAFPRYRLFKPMLDGTMQTVKLFCMQSAGDVERIKQLGADSSAVKLVGNIKFDKTKGDITVQRHELGLNNEQLVLVGGSTHPGEEEVLLDIYRDLRGQFPSLRLVLAPRHPERAARIEGLISNKGLHPVRFSDQKGPLGPEEVLVVDAIGHLLKFYVAATVAFVGKSLTAKGGHNIIEPAIFGKSIIIGPNMQNFQDITNAFLLENAVVQVPGVSQLYKSLADLLGNAQLRQDIGRRAQEVVRKNRGATQRTLDLINSVMERSVN
jgi:3-deoxy-D-manno-octulosonic-acid transferase